MVVPIVEIMTHIPVNQFKKNIVMATVALASPRNSYTHRICTIVIQLNIYRIHSQLLIKQVFTHMLQNLLTCILQYLQQYKDTHKVHLIKKYDSMIERDIIKEPRIREIINYLIFNLNSLNKS